MAVQAHAVDLVRAAIILAGMLRLLATQRLEGRILHCLERSASPSTSARDSMMAID